MRPIWIAAILLALVLILTLNHIPVAPPAYGQQNGDLENRVKRLEGEVSALQRRIGEIEQGKGKFRTLR